MRRLWSAVIVAVLALFLLSAAFVDAGGRKSHSLYENQTNKTDCSFQPYFTWTNYSDRSTYTARVWILHDGTYVPHPVYSGMHVMDWSTSGASGTSALANGGGLGPSTTAHTITYRATLTKEGTHPRLLIDTSLVFTDMYCSNVAS